MLKTILTISRPISWINTAAPFLAGYIVSGANPEISFFIGLLFFLFPYNLIMYGVNDIYDYESDKNNPRKNSVEGGLAPPNTHAIIWRWIGFSTTPFIVYMLSIGNLTAKLIFAVSMFTLFAYSIKGLRFKEIPFLDSFTSSAHFYTPLLYGLALGGADLFRYLPAILAFLVWGLASHALGAIQDVTFDRSAGINSIATVIGAKGTVLFALSCYIATALIVALAYNSLEGRLVAASLLLYVVTVAGCLNVTDSKASTTNKSWKQFLWINQITGFTITITYLASLPRFSGEAQWLLVGAFIVISLALSKAFQLSKAQALALR